MKLGAFRENSKISQKNKIFMLFCSPIVVVCLKAKGYFNLLKFLTQTLFFEKQTNRISLGYIRLELKNNTTKTRHFFKKVSLFLMVTSLPVMMTSLSASYDITSPWQNTLTFYAFVTLDTKQHKHMQENNVIAVMS